MAWTNPFMALEQRLARIENFLVQILLCEEQILIVQEQLLLDSLLDQQKINALTAGINLRTAELQAALFTVRPAPAPVHSEGETKMATGVPAIDTLVAAVAAEDTVIASAVTMLQGISSMIAVAVAAAVANGATAAQLAPLTTLTTDVQAQATALAAAVAANVPPAPPIGP